jgi:hypothetical protein
LQKDGDREREREREKERNREREMEGGSKEGSERKGEKWRIS